MDDISPEFQELKDRLSSKDSQIAGQQSEMMKRESKMQEMRKNLEEALRKLQAEADRVVSLENTLQQCTSDLANERITSHNANAALDAANSRLQAQERETQNLQGMLDTLSHQSQTSLQKTAQLEREKGCVDARIYELEANIRQLSQQQAEAQAASYKKAGVRPRSSSLSSFRVTSLEQDLTDLRAELAVKHAELRANTQRLSQVEGQLAKAQNEKNAIERKLQGEIGDLKLTLGERDDELAFLKERGDNSDREAELLSRIDEDEAKIDLLESQVRDAAQVPKLKSDLKVIQTELRAAEARNLEFETRSLDLVQEKEEALDELDDARSRITTLEKTVQELETKVVELTSNDNHRHLRRSSSGSSTSQEEAAGVARLLAAIQRVRQERDNLRLDLHFLQTETRFTVESLEAQLAEANSQNAHYSDPRLALTATASLVAIGYLQSKLDFFHDTFASRNMALAEAEKENHRLVEELQDVTEERDELSDQLQYPLSTPSELNAVREDVASLEDEVKTLSRTLESVESERSTLQLQVNNLTGELETAQEQLAAAERRYSELQRHQLSSMPETDVTRNLRTQITSLEARIVRRSEQIGIHQHDIRKLETNLALQEERLADMASELEMTEAQKNAMVDDCADAREQRDAALQKADRLEEELEVLECRVDDSEREIVALIGVIIDGLANQRRLQLSASELKSTLEDVAAESKQFSVALAESQVVLQQERDKLEAIRSAHGEAVSKVAALELELEACSAELQNLQEVADAADATTSVRAIELAAKVKELESSLTAVQVDRDHALAVPLRSGEELQKRVDEEQQTASVDLQSELVQLKMKHIEEIGAFQGRLVEANSALDEARARTQSSEQRAAELSRARAEAEAQLKRLSKEDDRLRSDISTLKSEHKVQLEALTEDLHSVEEEGDAARQTVEGLRAEIARVQENCNLRLAELEDEKQRLQATLEEEKDRLEMSADDVYNLRSQLQTTTEERTRALMEIDSLRIQCNDEATKHRTELAKTEDEHERLSGELTKMRAELEETLASFETLREAKLRLEVEMTDLEAEIQRELSVKRYLESQMREKEQEILSLQQDLQANAAKAAEAEKACRAAEMERSLQDAHHKREFAELRRQLDQLEARPNFESAMAELEERNNDMEEMLRQKCAEIEANDDKVLEIMRENKKLSSKCEALTRKVQNLQAKLAAAKAAIPKASDSGAISREQSSSPSLNSNGNSRLSPSGSATPLSSAPSYPSSHAPQPVSRQVSSTVSSLHPAPALLTEAGPNPITHRISSTSSMQSSRYPFKQAASASTLPRPKTPERRMHVTSSGARLQTPEPLPDHSSVPPSAAGKKRSAPDDFERCEQVPAQAFTPDVVPSNQTPGRSRRVLSSIQSGFTPVRRQGSRTTLPEDRPEQRPPSPAKRVVQKVGAYLSDVTTNPRRARTVTAPAAPILALSHEAEKSSWLGRIRSAKPAPPARFGE
ncbi:hypothetical protein FISHEDRAFT_39030 [Fistulina hepatica ATCC 64428]|uniref:Uncharacterized protein n=1 Tax=Fistulina hepatica ATCC 64428 TaxID=1128425 RepID=A0A0D7AH18_9AGAR|nr:hypothetical protein FISHEDRAFT_39030 [Fistulina hepatica ATCC 64428]